MCRKVLKFQGGQTLSSVSYNSAKHLCMGYNFSCKVSASKQVFGWLFFFFFPQLKFKTNIYILKPTMKKNPQSCFFSKVIIWKIHHFAVFKKNLPQILGQI